MKIEIKSIAGSILFSGDFSCLAEAVSAAVKKRVNLRSADLRSANLRSANLRSADLRSADLRSANLSSADLSYADLSYANLRSADLRSADLRSADLRSANLSSADLSYADLSYADLRSADLSSANLRSAKNSDYAIACTRILPEGDLIGWKKCLLKDDNKDRHVIVKLLIPAKAKRSHAFGRKCRADFVKVLQVIGGKVGLSMHDKTTEYRKGETVKCNKWEKDFAVECGGGIHFFITRAEAEAFEM